jgi:hypothetical protein
VAGFVARTGNTDPRAWHWRARVYDAKTKMVAERESSATASRELFATVVLDLAKEPSGGYDLDLKVWQEGDSLAMTRRAHFSIAWEPGSWERNPTEREDIVHFLLHPDVEERFARMHPGEQERFLVDFWKERDPTPRPRRTKCGMRSSHESIERTRTSGGSVSRRECSRTWVARSSATASPMKSFVRSFPPAISHSLRRSNCSS